MSSLRYKDNPFKLCVIDVCIVDSFIVYNHFFFTSIQKRTGCSAWMGVPRTSYLVDFHSQVALPVFSIGYAYL